MLTDYRSTIYHCLKCGAIAQVIAMIVLWAKNNGTNGMKEALSNIGRAVVSLALMIVVALFLDSFSNEFIRNTSLLTLISYSIIVGVFLFTLTLVIQKSLGSSDAKDILNELLGKVLRKLHLKC